MLLLLLCVVCFVAGVDDCSCGLFLLCVGLVLFFGGCTCFVVVSVFVFGLVWCFWLLLCCCCVVCCGCVCFVVVFVSC